MHHALEIEDILCDILGHFDSPHSNSASLAALARTCRAFKEPALNVLWEELSDLTPLVRCLPEASHKSYRGFIEYSFTRPLTETEWNVLRSYTCRIRSMKDIRSNVDPNSLRILSNPPTNEPLFPRLGHLYHYFTDDLIPLSHLPLPSLTRLEFNFGSDNVLRSCFGSLLKRSPNLRSLHIAMHADGDAFVGIDRVYLGQWQNLHTAICPRILLDVDTLVHLSRMPALTRLAFAVAHEFPTNSSITFSSLQNLALNSKTLAGVLALLSHLRLPVATDITCHILRPPSTSEVSTFFASVRAATMSHMIEKLCLKQAWAHDSSSREEGSLTLGWTDLLPCTAFVNIRSIRINIDWDVSLTDENLIMLASACPYLEEFSVNADWGWNAGNGITPNGLVQLLRTCQSLNRVALVIDTGGDRTEIPHLKEGFGLTLSPAFSINVLDSEIEERSIPDMVTFFTQIAPCPNFSFRAWDSLEVSQAFLSSRYWYTHKKRWDEVYRQVNEVLSRHS